jgi:hypothetical protein
MDDTPVFPLTDAPVGPVTVPLGGMMPGLHLENPHRPASYHGLIPGGKESSVVLGIRYPNDDALLFCLYVPLPVTLPATVRLGRTAVLVWAADAAEIRYELITP